MSNRNHTLNRLRAVHTVNGGLPLTQVEAHDALHSLAQELSVYEVETVELYAFGDRVRRILAEKIPSQGQLEKIATDLNALEGRITKQIQELDGGQQSVIPVSAEPVAPKAGDWPIG